MSVFVDVQNVLMTTCMTVPKMTEVLLCSSLPFMMCQLYFQILSTSLTEDLPSRQEIMVSHKVENHVVYLLETFTYN